MMLAFPYYDPSRFEARGMQICIYKPKPHFEVEESLAVSCWDKIDNKYVVYTTSGPTPEEFFSIFDTVRISGTFTDTKGMGESQSQFRLQCYGGKPASFYGPLMRPDVNVCDDRELKGKIYTGEIYARTSGSGDESLEHSLKIMVDGFNPKKDFCTGCDILIYYDPEEQGIIRFNCVGDCKDQYLGCGDSLSTVPDIFSYFKEFIIEIGEVPPKSKMPRKDIRPLHSLAF